MYYDKEYFRKKLRESKKKYMDASEADQEKMRRTAMRMADKSRSENLVGIEPGGEFLFFYSAESVFSQWYRCDFIVGNLHFTCTEQYMMYYKALLFLDSSASEAIIRAGYDPKRHKEIGRNVSGFIQQIWDKEKEKIVYQGNYYKFSQNSTLQEELIQTAPKILVEASPVDTIWGIGLAIDDPDRLKIENWKGENLLGFILTRLRNELIEV